MSLATRIRLGERRETAAAMGTIALVMVAHAALETARDTLFLTNLPARRLPWLYLSIAVLAVIAGPILGRSGSERANRRSLIYMQVVAALGTAAFVVPTSLPHDAALYALYLWGGMAGAVILARAWLILGDRLTVSQAKRLYPIIGSAAVFGSLVGYGSAGLLATHFGAHALLGFSASMFLASAGMSLLWGRVVPPVTRQDGEPHAASEEPDEEKWQSVAHVVRDPYVRGVALLLLLASVSVTLCDFAFKSAVAEALPGPRLGQFLAAAYFCFDFASLILMLGLVPWVVRNVGVPAALTVRPALLVIGGGLLVAFGGLPAALMVRGVDGALRWSLHKTATELLYVPLAPRVRRAVKEVSDLLSQRGGQAIGSLLLLAALHVAAPLHAAGPLLLACAGVWLALAMSLRGPYLSLFRSALSDTGLETRLDFPELDIASLETLLAGLNSPDADRVVAAVDLLAATGRGPLIPALILYHPSSAVLVQSLEVFARLRRPEVLEYRAHLLAHVDAAVRAAAARACAIVETETDGLLAMTASPHPVVAATAHIAAAARGHTAPDAALAAIRQQLSESNDDAPDARQYIARALREWPLPGFAPFLTQLLSSHDVAARVEAVRAIGELRNSAHLPLLVGALAQRALREAARRALLRYGEPAVLELERALADRALPYATRAHVPRALSRFGHQRAADILLAGLRVEPGGLIRYKILRGLGRLRADLPSLQLDAATLDAVVEDHIGKAYGTLDWCAALARGAEEEPARRTRGHALLLDLLRQRHAFAVERLFRVLGLRDPGEDFAQIYDALHSEDAAAQSTGHELLEHILPAPWREPMRGLIDDVPDADRLKSAGRFYEAQPVTYEVLIADLRAQASETLSALADYHATELGLDAAQSEVSAPPSTGAHWLSERLRTPVAQAGRHAVELAAACVALAVGAEPWR